MGKCLIISGGENCLDLFNKTFFEGFDYIIACDKGFEYASEAGIQPDLIIGDFDSVENGIDFTSIPVPIVKFPPEKDDTDTMLAVKKSLELGYKEIHIVCSLGNRLDHSYCNIQTGHYIADKGGKAVIYGRNETLYILKNDSIVLNKSDYDKGFGFSVFALSDVCNGVSITGAEYSVSEVDLNNSFPLGQSNDWKCEKVQILVKKGVLLVMICK